MFYSRFSRYIFFGLASVIFVFPLYWMITGSIKPERDIWASPPIWFPNHISFENYTHLFTTKPTLLWIFNSVFTSLSSTLFIVLFSAMSGYAFAKKKFPGVHFLFIFVVATMMLPRETTIVTLYILIQKMGFVNSYLGIILPAIAYPFGIFLVRQFSKTIPDDIIEAAKIDGAGEIRIFTTIIMPLLLPALGALSIFAFMNTWNDYLWQLVVLQSERMLTLPLGISAVAFEEITINYGFAMAGAALAAIPMIIFFISLQKSFIKGITLGSVKG